MRINQQFTISKGIAACVTTVQVSGYDDVQTAAEENAMLKALSAYIETPEVYNGYVAISQTDGRPYIAIDGDPTSELVTIQSVPHIYKLDSNLIISHKFNLDTDDLPTTKLFTTKTIVAEAYLTVMANTIKDLIVAKMEEMRKEYNTFVTVKIYKA